MPQKTYQLNEDEAWLIDYLRGHGPNAMFRVWKKNSRLVPNGIISRITVEMGQSFRNAGESDFSTDTA